MADQLEPNKRVRYFNGQVLRAEDLTQEQFYHLKRRQMHNRTLHTPGVVTGLEAEGAVDATSVKIKPGVAINAGGEEIVVDAESSVELANMAGITKAELYVVYDTADTDPLTAGGTPIRISEKPAFVLRQTAATAPTAGIPEAEPGRGTRLAELSLNGAGKLTAAPNNAVRARAGTMIGDDVTIRSLTWGNKSQLRTDQGGSIELGGDNTTAGAGTPYIDFHFSGQTQDFNVRIINDANGRLSVQAPTMQVSGNVGIGTAEPSGRLHVAGNADQAGTARFVPHANKGPHHSHVHFAATGDWYIRSASPAGKVVIQDTGGNVGVGTGAPSQKLSVSGAESTAHGFGAAVGLSNTAAGGRSWYLRAGATGTTTPAGGLSIADDTAYRLVIDGAGNIGIGTTAPTNKLHVNDNTGIRQNRLYLSGGIGGNDGWSSLSYNAHHNAPNNAWVFPDPARTAVTVEMDDWQGVPRFQVFSTTLAARTSWVQRFAIDGNTGNVLMALSGGNVGIGTGTPTERLHVVGDVRVDGGRIIGSLSGTVLGTKIGYVVDQFVNAVGDAIEEGDVVIIGDNQTSLYYEASDTVPIPEVDMARRAYDTRVCGIVAKVHAQVQGGSGPENTMRTARAKTMPARPAAKRRSPEVFEVRGLTPEELASPERSTVRPGQIGSMVTMGAFAHCKVDADIAPIETGDLLTTSATKGHAQKVLDPTKAVGAILGKALGPLKKGKGKIPVLVMLQ